MEEDRKILSLREYRARKGKVEKKRGTAVSAAVLSSDLEYELALRDNKILEVIDSLAEQIDSLRRRQAATLKILNRLLD